MSTPDSSRDLRDCLFYILHRIHGENQASMSVAFGIDQSTISRGWRRIEAKISATDPPLNYLVEAHSRLPPDKLRYLLKALTE